jgi:hypothetical protein
MCVNLLYNVASTHFFRVKCLVSYAQDMHRCACRSSIIFDMILSHANTVQLISLVSNFTKSIQWISSCFMHEKKWMDKVKIIDYPQVFKHGYK